LLYYILYQSFQFTIVLQARIPEDFLELTPEAREEAQKSLLEDFQKEISTNSEAFVRSFYRQLLDSPALLFLQSLLWAFAFLIPGYFLLKRLFQTTITDFSDDLSFSSIVHGVSHGSAVFFLVLLVQILFALTGTKIHPGIFPQMLFESLAGNTYLLGWSLYSVGLLTGIIEETFFRGFLLKSFLDKGYVREGLILVSVLFGLLHFGMGTSPIVPGMITGVGLYFGYVYLSTGNLWTTMTCHATYNCFGLILAFLRVEVGS